MSSFVERLRAELFARVEFLPGAVGDPMPARGMQTSENQLPRVWVWIDSDRVEQRSKSDEGDDASRFHEWHVVGFSVGVLTKNSTAAADMDTLVAAIRERMFPRFEGMDLVLQGVEYEDEVRTFARPFVSATLDFTVNYTTPDAA